jgi:hypothetical protein
VFLVSGGRPVIGGSLQVGGLLGQAVPGDILAARGRGAGGRARAGRPPRPPGRRPPGGAGAGLAGHDSQAGSLQVGGLLGQDGGEPIHPHEQITADPPPQKAKRKGKE